MFAAPQFTHTLTDAPQQSSATGSARTLARAYLDYVSGYWRGDPNVSKVGDQLATFFGVDMPAEPERPADAFSPHGAEGHGIRWYECGDAVLGYVPGATSGYRIPLACVAVLCSTATNVQIRGSNIVGNPRDSRAGHEETSGLPAQASLAHVAFPLAPTAVDAVA